MTRPTSYEHGRELIERFRAGERTALARAISIVADQRRGFEKILHSLHPSLGAAQRVGITGPPGAGKSTLTLQLATRYRSRDERVGVVAVDPTSPFTGGALLGDRIRLNSLATDPGVFIRSMATRGSLGGLAVGSQEVADLLDAYGFERVVLETVGVGQSELDIASSADSTVVVLVPESGDSIQAMKAGLMEIADIFVVNKADRPGADRMVRELEVMLHLRSGDARPAPAGHHGVAHGGAKRGRPSEPADSKADPPERWTIPVLATTGQSGDGVDALLETLDRHAGYLKASGELASRRRARLTERARAVVDRSLRRKVWGGGSGETILAEALPALESGEESPYSVAARIVRTLGLETGANEDRSP